MLLDNPGGQSTPLAKVENLPVDEVGNDHAEVFRIMCNCPIILENIDLVLVCAITSCMQE